MSDKDLRNLPKVELHLHLDCCLSFDVVKKIILKLIFKLSIRILKHHIHVVLLKNILNVLNLRLI